MDLTAEQLIARIRKNPDDAEAFSALQAHYHRLGDFASLANLLEGWAARSSSAELAAGAYYQAAEICVTRLHDVERAVTAYERALERQPIHMEASVRLQEILEQSGDTRRLLDVLEKRAEALTQQNADARHIAQVQHQIGEIYEHMQRVDRAVGAYRRAIELDPTLVPAIYAARQIYRNAGNLKAAAGLYDKEAMAETDPERKIALLRELAHMRAEQLHDHGGAVMALERALEHAPTNLSVMHDLATALLERAESLGDSTESGTERRRAAELLYQMSQSVPADHAVAYAEAALDGCPDHDGALEVLEQFASQTGREETLPLRWVAYLSAAPKAPGSDQIRRRLGRAYITAGQAEDAIICWEPLLERGDAEAAEALVDLYRTVGREDDLERALSVAVTGVPADKRIPRLREIIAILVGQGNHTEAAARAREILDLDAADPEALGLLEAECRERNAYSELRDLLAGAARVPGLAVEIRKDRLREVASISEEQLDDPDGAISAWRAVAQLDPADGDARKALERLLDAGGRWDELVQVLERDALSLTDPEEKAEVYRRLAQIHRRERDSLSEAIEALRNLRDIRPGDMPARDELCDALLEAGAFLEAVPLLRKRIDAGTREERILLLGRLADVLENSISDDEGAFETCTRLLDEDPSNIEALERMERIDARAERWMRLLETLGYKANVVDTAAQAELYRQMAVIADQKTADLNRAADLYGQALDLQPEDGETLDLLVGVYDRAERYRDLVALLNNRAESEQDPAARAELYRRIARTLAQRVQNDDAAAEAWREVLAVSEDREALAYLRLLAEGRGDLPELADLLRRLAILEDDEADRRELLFERAILLADQLMAPAEAIGVLREIVEKLDPKHVPSLNKLATLCEHVGDHARLADVLERQLLIMEDEGLRAPIARKLSNIYEHELDDRPRAITALNAWADADLTDPEPQRRLVELLGHTERWDELISALDSLAGIEQDAAEVGRLVRRSAQLCLERAGDVDGAWARLAARVEEGDGESEEELKTLARQAARGERLAELYVRLAQETAVESRQAARWRDAAGVFEELLGDHSRALESTLRAFASDLNDDSILDEVDRLASDGDAWERLAQVYDTLLRRADEDERKISLLMRHANILERGAGNSSVALDRVLRACSIAPNNEEVLVRAEGLAPAAGRPEELLIVYDRRRARAVDDAGRVSALLRAARLCDGSLGDRDQAMGYLAQAVSLSLRDEENRRAVEETVRAFDQDRPELGRNTAQLTLVDLYRRLAEKAAEDDPQNGGRLLQFASRMLAEDLGDEDRAYQYLKQAASFAPDSGAILDRLEEFSEETGRLVELEKHLDLLVDEALDQGTAVALLQRRGRILEVDLERYSDAADAWGQLLALRSADAETPNRLRRCLRKAGRHQDLLVVLEREVNLGSPEQQVALLKTIATTWERDLGNKWEAIDAYKRVLALTPEDEVAVDAVQRLGHSTRRLSTEEIANLDHTGEVPLPDSEPPLPGPIEPVEPSDLTTPSLDLSDATPVPGLFGDEDGTALTALPAEEPFAAEEVTAEENTAEENTAEENTAEENTAETLREGNQLDETWAREQVSALASAHGATAPALLSDGPEQAMSEREQTSEIDLAEVEELRPSTDEGTSEPLEPQRSPIGLMEPPEASASPVDPDATGELDALDLVEVDLDTAGELDALDLEDVSGLVELPDDDIEVLDDFELVEDS